MPTEFDSDTFEHDYIIQVLTLFALELRASVPEERTIDKYAMQLTAFMNGMIRGEMKREKV